MRHLTSNLLPCLMERWIDPLVSMHVVRFETLAAAREWLVGQEASAMAMMHLRELVSSGGADDARLSDDQVLDDLALQLFTSKLLVTPELQPLPPQGLSFGRGESAPSLPTVARKRAPQAPPPPAPEESTLPRHTDAAAMVATLTAAAADGMPFCEICEQRKRERAEATA